MTDDQLWTMVRVYHGFDTEEQMVESLGYGMELCVVKMREAVTAVSAAPAIVDVAKVDLTEVDLRPGPITFVPSVNQRLLDALRGMIGLVQLVQNRYEDFPVDNHRVIEAMSAIREAETKS